MKEDIELKILYGCLVAMLLSLTTLILVESYRNFTVTNLLKSCSVNYSEMCKPLLEKEYAGN